MFLCANEVNAAGVDVAQRAFFDTVEKYQRIRSMALYDLYSMSYINSPSVFDESGFLECLLQEHKDKVACLISQMSGKLLLTPQMVDYAIMKAKTSEDNTEAVDDFCKVMSIYRTYLCSQNILSDLTKAYNKVRFNRNHTQNFRAKVKVTLEGIVTVTTPIAACEVFGEYATHYADEQLVVYDVRHMRWLLLAQKLGISQLVINEHIKQNKALYVKGISRDMELSLFEELLRGDILCDGYYGELLSDFVTAHYDYDEKDNAKKRLRYIPDLVRVVCAEFAEDINNSIENFRALHSKWKIAPLQVSTDYILFKEKIHEDEEVADYKGMVYMYEPSMPYEQRWSPFAVDYSTGEALPIENRIAGICGELIPLKVVKEKGYAVMGIPVPIHEYQFSVSGDVEDVVVYYYYAADVYYNGQMYEGEPVAKNVSIYPKYLGIIPQDNGDVKYVSRLSVNSCIATVMRKCHYTDMDIQKYSTSLLFALLYADNCEFNTTIPTLAVDSLENRQKALYITACGYNMMKG